MPRLRMSHPAWRVGFLAVAVAAFGLPGPPASAYGIVTDKTVYRLDETIRITLDLFDLQSGKFRIEHGAELYDDLYAAYPYPDDPEQANLPRDVVQVLELPAWRVMDPLGLPNRESDPHRLQARLVLSGEQEGSGQPVEVSTWITLLMETAAAPGALDLGGRSRIAYGESLAPRIADLAALLAANADPAGGPGHLELELFELGRIMPGGAVVADRNIDGVSLLDLPGPLAVRSWQEENARYEAGEPDPWKTTLSYTAVGFHELRLIGRGGAVLDRVAFEVTVADFAGALHLQPTVAGAYDNAAPPAVELQPDPAYVALAYPGWAQQLQVTLARREPGQLRPVAEVVGGYEAERLATLLPPPSLADPRLPPGPYRLLLYGLGHDHPYRLRVPRLDGLDLELGGSYPPDWLPRPQLPLLQFGDVALQLAPADRLQVGTLVTVSLTPPADIDLVARGAWLELRYAPEVWRRDCQVFASLGKHRLPFVSLPLEGGPVSFRAPSIPEAFEVRLYEADGDGEPRLLATAPLSTELPSLPGALTLAAPPLVGQSLRLLARVPSTAFWNQYDAELWRSAEVVPGGALRAAHRLHSVAVGDDGAIDLGPVMVPGLYEVRLLARGTRQAPDFDVGVRAIVHFGVDRLAFEVTAPEQPALPAEATFRPAPELDAWPQPGDPRRGLAAWQPAPEDCLPAEPPPGGIVTVVELHNGVLGDPADDLYLPVASLFPGHPYLLEARFESAPPADRYAVLLPDGRELEVLRTGDPRLYRSGFFTIVPSLAP